MVLYIFTEGCNLRLFFTEKESLPGGEAARLLLSRAWSAVCEGEMPEISKTPAGKPFFPARPDVYFSISHTKTHVLAAIGNSPVGADIETCRPLRPGIWHHVGSEAELYEFGFFPLWTLKESYIKLFGEAAPMRQLRFERSCGIIKTPHDCVFARLYDNADNCSAAVCVLGEEPPRSAERLKL